MATIEEINKLKKTLQEIYDQMGRRNPINVDNIKDAARAAEVLNKEIAKARQMYVDSSTELGSIAAALQANVQEITRGNQGLLIARRSFRSISEITNKILADQEGITELSSKQIESLQAKLALDAQRLKISKDILESRQSEALSIINSQDASSKEREKARKDFVESQKAINQINNELGITNEKIAEERSNLEIVNRILENRLDLEKRIQKRIGLSGSIMKGLSNVLKKIGFEGFDDIIEETIAKQRELARISIENRKKIRPSIRDIFSGIDFSKGNRGDALKKTLSGAGNILKNSFTGSLKLLKSGLGTSLKVFSAGLLGVGKIAFRALTSVTTIILGTLKQIGKAILEVDTQAEKLARTFNLTYREAAAIRSELAFAASSSEELALNSLALQKTLSQINERAGGRTFANLSENLVEANKQLTLLREQSGLEAEQIQVIADLFFLSGRNVDDIAGSLLGVTEVLAAQEGFAINEREIFKDISELSKATLLSLQATPRAIQRAFVEATLLGTSLQKVDNISEGLLDFQGSIRKELEAIVLTGRDLNLNAARFYALNNDTAGVARELRNQIGSAAEFADMNRIAQNSIAAALGMSRDEMAEMLFIEENLSGLQGEALKVRNKSLQLLLDENKIEDAITLATEDQLERLDKQIGLQSKYQLLLSRLKDIFIPVAENLLNIFEQILPTIESLAVKLSNVSLDTLKSGITQIKEDVNEIIEKTEAALTGGAIGAIVGAIAGSFIAPGVGTAIGAGIGAYGGAKVNMGIFDMMQPGGLPESLLKGSPSISPVYIPRRNETVPSINSSTTTNTSINNSSSTATSTTNTATATNEDVVAAVNRNTEAINRMSSKNSTIRISAGNFGTQANVASRNVQYG